MLPPLQGPVTLVTLVQGSLVTPPQGQQPVGMHDVWSARLRNFRLVTPRTYTGTWRIIDSDVKQFSGGVQVSSDIPVLLPLYTWLGYWFRPRFCFKTIKNYWKHGFLSVGACMKGMSKLDLRIFGNINLALTSQYTK